ncbi:ULK/ULK protein kinase Atg1 [Schizosaccharomyces cryophilus OY26]|uniref:non-specific serine/threonine protein kinase n=1 Tax=Schizosaccharomyces cryophilus (strain OY26 / ATCC MYA-4695 / CBS 11777 / NBRC 106824 / NRRL Y48691) TaxID=653667 RepID=S9WYI2_SCHCR|nr:ULK/ULK protein kinase Atg1 [Schizosaccharomyces cryophilus OY26]EPY49807.1 ULK/ULK protein kinase Atg1 [Schizosaccharomyces cryophilus OY26]
MNAHSNNNQSIGPYVIRSEIGRGSFAIVYKGKHSETKRVVSIKSVLTKKLTKKLLENLESEISILKEIRHVHVVELIDCIKVGRFIHLVMEYCSLGDLSYFIRKREKFSSIPSLAWINVDHPPVYKGGLNETLVRHFLKQLASALQFLRSRSLIHRDVKPQNLLLQPPPTEDFLKQHPQFIGNPKLPMLKLADFGFARYLQTSSMAETLCGSPLYMAPEILRYEKYDAKADLWSVGAVLYEMAVGKPPFKAPNHVELLRRIQRAKDVIKFPEEAYIHPDIKGLICALLKQNPADRIDYDQFFSSMVITTPVVDDSTLTGSDIQDAVRGINIPSSSPAYITDFFPKSNPNNPPGGLLRQAFQAQGSVHQPGDISNRRLSTRYAQDGTALPHAPAIFPPESAPPASNYPYHLNSKTNIPISEHKHRNNHVSDKSSTYVVVDRHNVNSFEHHSDDELDLVQNQEPSLNGNSASPNEDVFHGSFSPESLPSNPQTYIHPRRIPIPYMKANAYPPHNAYLSHTPVTQLRRAFEQTPITLPNAPAGNSHESALERALNVANAKLNHGVDGITSKSPIQSLPKQATLPNRTNAPIISQTIDRTLMEVLENLAAKSNAVFHMAEVKLIQVLPSLEVDDTQFDSMKDARLTSASLVSLVKESLTLYQRDIELLQIAFDFVATVWSNNDEKNTSECREAMNWYQQRYAESLEKTQFLKAVINSYTFVNTQQTAKPTFASQLIYQRALDISRNAATSELSGNDLVNSLRSYKAASNLLESLLEGEFSTPNGTEDFNNTFTIQKLTTLISKRLDLLQSKLQGSLPNVTDKVSEGLANMTLTTNYA